ncbi:PEP-CTERM sorting domain-containing protein [Polymorphobacter arshaanensis]|uniref:PEP-CTERM sorting domain-containing protein n=1 Tax=Glacieibacterium arshaanense TaxID=2511025 RepID=A0A4Y9EKP9_9SPHN|nr:NF038122 family metalloprotease [Polymorphobacter arshaanensis]TFU01343.1 PEP-CTERM sorting domain-containing protein [Polymorphobacter arshaanensis]
MKSKLLVAAAVGAVLAASPASALKINLIDTGGVTGSPAEAGFKLAAQYWESVLTNDAIVNFNVGFAPLGPGILGGTSSSLFTYVPVDDYKFLLAVTGNSALDAQAVAGLAPTSSTGSLTVTVPEYFNVSTLEGVAASGSRIAPDNTAISATLALSTANVKALVGGFDTVIDADITFSSTFAFDFNPRNGITAGKYDFVGVAVHEMGHALGFLSGAQDFDYSVGGGYPVDDFWWGYGLDMFRYSAPGVLDWTFGTDSYFSLDGGQTVFNGGYWSTGAINGDGWQASHWKAPGTCSNFLGIMNPYICNGLTDSVSGLDLAALDAIGWNTNVDVLSDPDYSFSTADMAFASTHVPEPAAWAMMITGFGMIGGALRRRRTGFATA